MAKQKKPVHRVQMTGGKRSKNAPTSTLRFDLTSLLYHLGPRHQLFNPFGLIFVVRHIEKYRFQIRIDIQVVEFCSSHQTVNDGTAPGVFYCIREQEIFPSHCIRTGDIVRYGAAPIQQVVHSSSRTTFSR